MEEEIVSITFGLVYDDFLHARKTGIACLKDGSKLAFKRYDNGNIFSFDDQRYTGGEYIERKFDPLTEKQITNFINGI